VTYQRISIQIILSLILASAQQLFRSVVLIMTCTTIDGQRDKVRACGIKLLRQTTLGFEQRQAATWLNERPAPGLAVSHLRISIRRKEAWGQRQDGSSYLVLFATTG
jgi:hypothetical protein